MCTLVFAWQTFADRPITVAANRDEAADRPSEPPHRWDREPAVFAPRDGSAGGTWIGYNDRGVFAALTNRWLDESRDGERSRGLLVSDVLGTDSAREGTRLVESAVERDSYAGFNLVIADQSAALYLAWDGSLSVRPLEPGLHVVVNVGADGAYRIPKRRLDAGRRQAEHADAIRTALQPEPGEEWAAWLERASETIADHDYGVCVHGSADGPPGSPPPGFGTQSSSLLALTDSERDYWFADGPPCETDYERLEGQL